MGNDYRLRLENLKGRRYDEASSVSVLSEAFHTSDHSDCTKYALESMLEVDPAYGYQVYAISCKIQEKIAKELKKKGFQIAYRYQGELKTSTNIMLYGEVEIIVLKKNITGKPHIEVQSLALELMKILQGNPNFESVEYHDKTRIRITAVQPACKINILPSVWVNSREYNKTKNEIYRGITEFDFKNRKVKKYLPFLNIARINAKDDRVNGNLKNLIRLLKTLCADSEDPLALKDSEISAIVYSMSREDLQADERHQLQLLPRVAARLYDLHLHGNQFDGLLSPSGKDRVFDGNPRKKAVIGKLHESLEELIDDIKKDLEKRRLTLDSEIPYSTASIH